ncbi:MAG TPA: hypothetical protein PK590_02430 [Candidatus Omnitrophota bacterium]|nr:hypothetical protein [Candidatus Omnitrophota bacterium]
MSFREDNNFSAGKRSKKRLKKIAMACRYGIILLSEGIGCGKIRPMVTLSEQGI